MALLKYLRDVVRGGTVFEGLPFEDPRLGRHIRHDPRSRLYDARKIVKRDGWPTTRVQHQRVGPIFDQGQLGMCTACAALGTLMTGPLAKPGEVYTLDDARALYSLSTRLDEKYIKGVWPPTDTGSSGLASMQALGQQRRIRAYYHAFKWEDFVKLLARQPVSVGTVWLPSMNDIDAKGYLRVDITQQPEGGHQWCASGVAPNSWGDYDVEITNSWGTGWARDGKAWIRGRDMRWLLSQDGDAVSPVR